MMRDPSSKKALVRYRMERARETLRAAEALHQQNKDAASIVNRAYYAMFYAALAMLATIGQQSSKHGGVLASFDQYFVKPKILPKEMGKFLHRAFDLRLRGDYEDEVKLTKEQAAQVLESAVDFIKSIEEKLAENA